MHRGQEQFATWDRASYSVRVSYPNALGLPLQAVSTPERVLLVRALMRLDRHREALDAIADTRTTTLEEAAFFRALESSCHAFLGSVNRAGHALLGIGTHPATV